MTDLFVNQMAGLLADIGDREATGALRITVDGGMRMAFFENGALVYVASDLAEDALGPALTHPGRLDSSEARATVAALEQQVTRKQPLVSLLLSNGVVEADRLRFWLVEHAYETFARVFDARSGMLKFAEAIRAEHPLPFGVPIPNLLLEAVRRMKDEWVVREAVGPLELTTEPAPDHAERIQDLPLSFYDGLVASQITHKMALAELLSITGLPEIEVLKALLALRLAGVLAPFEQPRGQTHTGRLRMRQAALATGVPLDSDAAAVALAMAVRPETPADGAITMDELAGATRYEPPHAPIAAVPEPGGLPRRRGNTAQLKLLSSAYKQMAEAELEAGNIAGSVQYYESALAQSPDNLELLMGLARVLVEKANGPKAAEKLLERARGAHPREIAPRVELAKLLRATGRHTQAEEVLREARRIDPDDPVVAAMLQKKEEKGGGLFARFRGGGSTDEPKPKPDPFAGVKKTKLEQVPLRSESGSLLARRCPNCGAMCRPGASACGRCGATV